MMSLRLRLAVALSVGALVALALVALAPHAHRASANPLTGIASVSLGADNTCAVTTVGGVKCWGYYYGAVPASIPGLASGTAAVKVGFDHFCALTTAGGVKCWGDNSFGQLGNGTYVSSVSPVTVSGLGSGVVAISAGEDYTCALTTASGMKCWGRNERGQLGDGSFYYASNTPVDVVGLSSGVAAIGAGHVHACAVMSGGSAKCWGSNQAGQLGDGTFTDSPSPVGVVGLANGASLGAGGFHTCTVTTTGAVSCWGAGFGTTAVAVGGFSGVSSVASGVAFFCVRTTAGAAKCRGDNGFGQLGDGQLCGTQCSSPVDVTGLGSGVSDFSVGYRHACVATSVGGAKCWGHNSAGQLGDGTTTNRSVPFDVVVASPKPTATNTPCPTPGCPTATRTPTPSQGIDFSIGADADGDGTDDCSSRSGPSKCSVSSSSTFTLHVYLNSLPAPPFAAYVGFDLYVTYTGLSSKDNATTDAWPNCAYPARLFSAGRLRWACASSSNNSTSTYTGLIGANDFNCTNGGTITLVHGDGDTGLADPDGHSYHEPQGSTETLTINCPTPTPTLSPTPTRTPHPPPLGGVAEYPNASSGPGAGLLLGLAAAIAFVTIALGATTRRLVARRRRTLSS